MIDKREIFEIHRLFHEGYSIRKIATKLRISRQCIKKYLEQPEALENNLTKRGSKLDLHKAQISEYLDMNDKLSAVVTTVLKLPQLIRCR